MFWFDALHLSQVWWRHQNHGETRPCSHRVHGDLIKTEIAYMVDAPKRKHQWHADIVVKEASAEAGTLWLTQPSLDVMGCGVGGSPKGGLIQEWWAITIWKPGALLQGNSQSTNGCCLLEAGLELADFSTQKTKRLLDQASVLLACMHLLNFAPRSCFRGGAGHDPPSLSSSFQPNCFCFRGGPSQ